MENQYYLGLDLDDEYAVISFFQLNMKEPETVSTVAGREVYQIPALLARHRKTGQWCAGEEAVKLMRSGEGEVVDAPFGRALRGEQVPVGKEFFPAKELFALFLKKVLWLSARLKPPAVIERLVVSLDSLSREVTELFAWAAAKLNFTAGQVTLLDRKECFYYFCYSQNEELMRHDVCLFDCRGEELRCLRISRNQRTIPQVVTLAEERTNLGSSGRDEAFLEMIKNFFQGRTVSSVYLVGDGFEGNWMKLSVAYLCRGRRAFIGKNLYSKGACYAAAVRAKKLEWPYVYLGDNEMKVNVYLKVRNSGATEFFTLISAGDNWYEAVGECEVLLDGTPEIDFWLQQPDSREARIEKLELTDLPERPPRATRLQITAKPLSDSKVCIGIKDLGFGEIFPASEKMWEYVMSLSAGS